MALVTLDLKDSTASTLTQSEGLLDLEIIIPALNEAQRLPATLRQLSDVLAVLPLRCSIVVIDNGSVDGTADIARALTTAQVPVRVIGCATPGKGAAVRRGVLSSSAHWVGFCDADLATSLSAVKTFVEVLAAGAPVVIGSRRISGAELRVRHGLARRVGSYGFRRIIRRFLPDIADSQCGFKFFRTDVARPVFESVVTNGFAFDVEVLIRTAQHGLPVVELPVSWESCAGSSFKLVRDGMRAAAELYTIRRVVNQDDVLNHRLNAASPHSGEAPGLSQDH